MLELVTLALAANFENRTVFWHHRFEWQEGLVHVDHIGASVPGWPEGAAAGLIAVELDYAITVGLDFEFTNLEGGTAAPVLTAAVDLALPFCCGNLLSGVSCAESLGPMAAGQTNAGDVGCAHVGSRRLDETDLSGLVGLDQWWLEGILSARYRVDGCDDYEWTGERFDEGSITLNYVYSTDLDGSGLVDGRDLVLVLSAWNEPFGFEDLLAVLNAWGTGGS